MLDCDVLLMLGTDFPYRQFYPQGSGVRIAQVDIRAENIGRRVAVDLGVVGDVRATLEALLPLLEQKRDGTHLAQARQHYAKARKALDDLAVGTPGRRQADPSAADRQGDQRSRSRGRRLHLRRRPADGVGRALSRDERQAAAHRLVLARLDGQCDGAGESARRRHFPAGR